MVVCFSCGAVPVVLVLVCLLNFSCNIEAGAPGRHEGVCRDVVRAKGHMVARFLAVRFLWCFFFCFVFFYLATSKEGNED